jgi:hypothetical protein
MRRCRRGGSASCGCSRRVLERHVRVWLAVRHVLTCHTTGSLARGCMRLWLHGMLHLSIAVIRCFGRLLQRLLHPFGGMVLRLVLGMVCVKVLVMHRGLLFLRLLQRRRHWRARGIARWLLQMLKGLLDALLLQLLRRCPACLRAGRSRRQSDCRSACVSRALSHWPTRSSRGRRPHCNVMTRVGSRRLPRATWMHS